MAQKTRPQSAANPESRPPPQPVTTLRGHSSPIHALHFYCSNERLASGDSDGNIVVWSVVSRRPLYAWRAHKGAILGIKTWNRDVAIEQGQRRAEGTRMITHGRDSRLYVWDLSPLLETGLSATLPLDLNNASASLDPAIYDQPQPWLLHTLAVPAITFCAFAACFASLATEKYEFTDPATDWPDVLVATPSAQSDSGIAITHLPTEQRLANISPPREITAGMVLALSIFERGPTPTSPEGSNFILAAGYESGCVLIFSILRHTYLNRKALSSKWTLLSYSTPHAPHPILSLSPVILPASRSPASSSATQKPPSVSEMAVMSSGASARLALTLIPTATVSTALQVSSYTANDYSKTAEHLLLYDTKHAGQQSLTSISISSKSRGKRQFLAAAGWDGRARIWHLSSSRHSSRVQELSPISSSKSTAVIDDDESGITSSDRSESKLNIEYKIREFAVLKWHREGCYVAEFADVICDGDENHTKSSNVGEDNEVDVENEKHPEGEKKRADEASDKQPEEARNAADEASIATRPNDSEQTARLESATLTSSRHTSPAELPSSRLSSMRISERKRVLAAQRTHWLAVGAKDGVVSLWNVI